MNPPQNQNPNSQTPPPSNTGAEPSQSFAPQAIFSHPPLSPEQIQQQAEQEEKVLKNKRLIKKIVIISPISILVVGSLVALFLSGIIPLQKFKTVTYTNSKGQQFRLKFYTQHRIDEISVPQSSINNIASTMQFLIANKGSRGRAPLAITIMKLARQTLQ